MVYSRHTVTGLAKSFIPNDTTVSDLTETSVVDSRSAAYCIHCAKSSDCVFYSGDPSLPKDAILNESFHSSLQTTNDDNAATNVNFSCTCLYSTTCDLLCMEF